MTFSKRLHERINVYAVGAEAYVVEPVSSGFQSTLSIQRLSGELSLNASNSSATSGRRLLTAYGIMGMISLTASEYLIVITGRELRGQILGHNIYRATNFEILPLQNENSVQLPAEAYLLGLLRSHLNSSLLWFSYDWDLSRRLQAQYVGRPLDANKALWEVADDRFFWNKYLQSRLIQHSLNNVEQDLSQFILPMLCGSFDVRHTSIRSRPLQFILISRRSRYRAGTRYFRRGVDRDGHVANYNETEQIAILEKSPADHTGSEISAQETGSTTFLSFVQTRGSVPIYWSEVNNLRYKPDIQVMDLHDTSNAIRNHLQEQLSLYGPQIMVNLLNQRGHEKSVNDAFELHASALDHPKLRYEHFDFHRECKHMRWDRIDLLIDRLQEDIIQQGYFYEDESGSREPTYQIGTVRTNCLDNLDRTNVFQSALAKWTLTRQLRDVGILDMTDSVDSHEAFMKDYRNMWADHANVISMSYSGTGALKTDFTRTGKRTKMGALQDGYISALRYLKNNFFDGPRQDAFDLVTGSWVPRKGRISGASLISDNRTLTVRSMPYVLYFSLFMICAGMTLPRSSDLSLKYYFLLWAFLACTALSYIFTFGVEYVGWPRLLPLQDIIDYSGPGDGSAKRGRGFKQQGKKSATGVNGNAVLQRGRSASFTNEVEKGSKKRLD